MEEELPEYNRVASVIALGVAVALLVVLVAVYLRFRPGRRGVPTS